MKKFVIIISVFALIFTFAASANCENEYSQSNIENRLLLSVKTLKYEQKQLVYAIITGNINAVKTILEADENPKTTYANIPLTMFAIYSDNTEILRLLVEYKFDPNETLLNVTPLELAIAMKKYESIEYLLSIGVTIQEEDIELIKKSKDSKLKNIFKNIE